METIRRLNVLSEDLSVLLKVKTLLVSKVVYARYSTGMTPIGLIHEGNRVAVCQACGKHLSPEDTLCGIENGEGQIKLYCEDDYKHLMGGNN